MSKSEPTHYSYTVYADPATAQTFDRRRFGGPIGELIAAEQGRVLANFVGRIKDRVILDVGTGTGRAALMLARGGARVTGVDASAEMLAVARAPGGGGASRRPSSSPATSTGSSSAIARSTS